MKDFYDIWLMTRQFDFKGKDLASAIQKTFEHRKLVYRKNLLFVPEIYDKSSDQQTLWGAFLQKAEIKHAPLDT